MITEEVTERTITPEGESRIVTPDGQERRSINVVDSRGGSVTFRHVSTQPEQYRLLQDGEDVHPQEQPNERTLAQGLV